MLMLSDHTGIETLYYASFPVISTGREDLDKLELYHENTDINRLIKVFIKSEYVY